MTTRQQAKNNTFTVHGDLLLLRRTPHEALSYKQPSATIFPSLDGSDSEMDAHWFSMLNVMLNCSHSSNADKLYHVLNDMWHGELAE